MRFFFHIYDDDVTIDQEGTSLADGAAAIARAHEEARQLGCQEVLDGYLALDHRIEVADEQGSVIASVRFGDAIAVRR